MRDIKLLWLVRKSPFGNKLFSNFGISPWYLGRNRNYSKGIYIGTSLEICFCILCQDVLIFFGEWERIQLLVP